MKVILKYIILLCISVGISIGMNFYKDNVLEKDKGDAIYLLNSGEIII